MCGASWVRSFSSLSVWILIYFQTDAPSHGTLTTLWIPHRSEPSPDQATSSSNRCSWKMCSSLSTSPAIFVHTPFRYSVPTSSSSGSSGCSTTFCARITWLGSLITACSVYTSRRVSGGQRGRSKTIGMVNILVWYALTLFIPSHPILLSITLTPSLDSPASGSTASTSITSNK